MADPAGRLAPACDYRAAAVGDGGGDGERGVMIVPLSPPSYSSSSSPSSSSFSSPAFLAAFFAAFSASTLAFNAR